VKQEVLWSRRGGFVPIFKCDGHLHLKFITSLIMMVQCWRGNVTGLRLYSPENTDTVKVVLQRSPSKLTRKAAAQLGTPRHSVQQILKSDLNLYPYKMTVLPKSSKQISKNGIYWMGSEWGIVQQCLVSDEADFHLDGVVNKPNVQFWVSENPYVIHEMVHHALRITVWVAISSHGLLRPIFLRDSEQWALFTVNMLCNTFMPHLLATGLLLQTQWFMQDGARLHRANVVLDFMKDTFNSGVISNRFPDRFTCEQKWPLNSLDLNPWDYFLWGFLKENVFLKKLQTLMELRALITQACNETTEDMCSRVINITVCVKEVARCNGSHVKHLIHRGQISMQWSFFLYVSF
jgi:hypothetical protein